MNSRQTIILTHAASWAALMVVPMMWMGLGDGLASRHVLVSVGVTLSFMTVFYLNFLWLTPRYYRPRAPIRFTLSNMLVWHWPFTGGWRW